MSDYKEKNDPLLRKYRQSGTSAQIGATELARQKASAAKEAALLEKQKAEMRAEQAKRAQQNANAQVRISDAKTDSFVSKVKSAAPIIIGVIAAGTIGIVAYRSL